ncbi:MAG: acetate--CoA ligase family protein [Solirubrobacteraceae bacterium]
MTAVETGAVLDLGRLMAPTSIAVVGATDRPGSYAGEALLNIAAVGFEGTVWGVNPRREDVLGHPCVPSVTELPVAVDALVVAIPAAGVAEVIEQAGARGCGGAVVLSAGFGEVPQGAAHQRDLVAAAARHRLPVCGPNCNGIVAPGRRIALWGDALVPREPGTVALVSQSGNVAVNALASKRGLRFDTVIASGNQAVLTAADYLEFLAHDDRVGSIALYLEDDGGPGLCDALAACAEAGVPVVVLKVGRSPAGAQAAAAHSGALTGDQRVFRGLVSEAGAVWADDVHDLLELAKTLAVPGPGSGPARARTPERGLAIMTCSGGDSAQGADEAQRIGLELPELAPATVQRLRALLPGAATVANPLDYTTMLWGVRDPLAELVRTLGEDPAIGQVLVFYDQPPGLTGASEESWRAVREAVIAGAALSPVATLVSSTLPELLDDVAAWEFARAGVAAGAGLRTGLRCAAARLRSPGDAARLREIGALARALDGRGRQAGEWLAEDEAKALLRAEGLSVPDGRTVAGEDDAVAALAALGGHVALKLSAGAVQHKSELDAVVLHLRSEPELRLAYRRLAALAGQYGGTVLAERMASPGLELLVAARADAIVPALVLGLGGIWAELLDDVVIVPLPADAGRIERALRSLRGAPLLLGGRGGARLDLGAAATLAEGIARVLVEHSLAVVECNPVVVGVDGTGAVAVDAAVRRRG